MNAYKSGIKALAGMLVASVLFAPASATEPHNDIERNLRNIPRDLQLPPAKRITGDTPEWAAGSRRGSTTTNLFTDGFESGLNTPWQLFVATGAADAFWGSTTVTASQGSRSAFCAAQGSQAANPGVTVYPDDMDAWMYVGPFDYSDAIAGGVLFDYFLSSEASFDFLQVLVSADGFTTYGGVQDSGTVMSTFAPAAVDFSTLDGIGSVIGQPQVYLAFRFTSDENTAAFGAFVDQVAIQKVTDSTGPTPTPTPSPTPSPSPTAGPTASPTATPTPSATPSPTPAGGITKTFTIFNDGNGTLSVTSLSPQNNSTWLTIAPTGPFTINAGSSRSINVTVSPAGLSPGQYTDRILIVSNDADENPYPNGVHITYNVGSVATPTPTPTPPAGDPLNAILNAGSAAGADTNGDLVVDIADVVFP